MMSWMDQVMSFPTGELFQDVCGFPYIVRWKPMGLGDKLAMYRSSDNQCLPVAQRAICRPCTSDHLPRITSRQSDRSFWRVIYAFEMHSKLLHAIRHRKNDSSILRLSPSSERLLVVLSVPLSTFFCQVQRWFFEKLAVAATSLLPCADSFALTYEGFVNKL